MGVEDAEQQFSKEMENLGGFDTEDEEGSQTRPLHSPSLKLEMSSNDGDATPQFENSEKGTILDHVQLRNSFPLERICEESSVADKKQVFANDFIPALRSGEWSDIGSRSYMEDTHFCIENLAKYFQCEKIGEEAISLYGVFDGHDGKGAAQFVRDQLPRIIVEDVDFPLELEKVVKRSFMKTDAAFANSCSLESALSSGTTALTAMIFGRSLLVANAGDCRAVLSRGGVAIEMSKIHRPCSLNERMRIESLGGYIDGELLNGYLSVTRALGDWHIEGLKKGEKGGPLSAEPELKLWTLTKEDEFLIIGSDGIWDVFINQNAVDFARRRLQEHNNVKRCCREIVDEAKKREATDNLTVIIVCFHLEPPPSRTVQSTRVGRIFPDWAPLKGLFPSI